MANKRAPPLHLFPTHGGPKENVEEARGDRDLREVAERARLAEADEGGERPVEAVEFADEDVGRLRALKAPIIYAEATASFHNPHIHFHYCRLVWRDKLLSFYFFLLPIFGSFSSGGNQISGFTTVHQFFSIALFDTVTSLWQLLHEVRVHLHLGLVSLGTDVSGNAAAAALLDVVAAAVIPDV